MYSCCSFRFIFRVCFSAVKILIISTTRFIHVEVAFLSCKWVLRKKIGLFNPDRFICEPIFWLSKFTSRPASISRQTKWLFSPRGWKMSTGLWRIDIVLSRRFSYNEILDATYLSQLLIYIDYETAKFG